MPIRLYGPPEEAAKQLIANLTDRGILDANGNVQPSQGGGLEPKKLESNSKQTTLSEIVQLPPEPPNAPFKL